ncbi:MAG TPA: glycosyltransferase [Steroidobacteraceae bacterium]|nr:glycosyltransferase [Steroidobacteraceae bacterium]
MAMATYNGERFLEEQLLSLATQSRLPDELVVGDDHSTDRTPEILERFSRTAPFPVTVYRNERNVGFSDNFLGTASRCSGEWIAFCDQDDVWLPEKLSTLEQYTNIPGRNVLAIAHNAYVVDECLRRSGIHYHNVRRTLICAGHRLPYVWVASGFTMMFRADLVSSIPYEGRGPDPNIPHVSLGHDVWISRLARILGDVVILPDDLALYRRHALTTSAFLSGGNERVKNSRKLYPRIRQVAELGANSYKGHGHATRYQAEAFGRLAREPRLAKWRDRFLKAQKDYAALSKWLLRRSRIYAEQRLRLRMWYLVVALLRGGYLRFNCYSMLNAKKILKEIVFDVAIAFYGPR